MAFDVPTCLYERKSPFCYQNELSFLVPQNGGDKRDRTADLLNAIQALSQLSYTPEYPICRKSGNQTIKLSKVLLKWGYVLVHYALPAELYPHIVGALSNFLFN